MSWLMKGPCCNPKATQNSTRSKNKAEVYCKSRMILSSYMHSLEWTGYLSKIGREPILFMYKLHQIVMKIMFVIICAESMNVAYARSQNSYIQTTHTM